MAQARRAPARSGVSPRPMRESARWPGVCG
jgi:hypothetical protein